jgi:hypothetical protein
MYACRGQEPVTDSCSCSWRSRRSACQPPTSHNTTNSMLQPPGKRCSLADNRSRMYTAAPGPLLYSYVISHANNPRCKHPNCTHHRSHQQGVWRGVVSIDRAAVGKTAQPGAYSTQPQCIVASSTGGAYSDAVVLSHQETTAGKQSSYAPTAHRASCRVRSHATAADQHWPMTSPAAVARSSTCQAGM